MADKRPAARANEIVMGKVLAALNAAAGSKALDRFNLRKPLEQGVYSTTKSGFRFRSSRRKRKILPNTLRPALKTGTV